MKTILDEISNIFLTIISNSYFHFIQTFVLSGFGLNCLNR